MKTRCFHFGNIILDLNIVEDVEVENCVRIIYIYSAAMTMNSSASDSAILVKLGLTSKHHISKIFMIPP